MYDDSYYILKSRDVKVNKTLVMTPDGQQELKLQIDTLIDNYFNNVNPNSPLVGISNEVKNCTKYFLVEANQRHTIITYEKFKNVLVIPTFKDSRHSRFILRDAGDVSVDVTQKPNIGIHLLPIINKVFDTSPNIYVAYPPEHISLYKYLMEQYDVNIIPSNKMYSELGLDDYTITPPSDVKFDMVIILGADCTENTKFDIADLKNDFAEYCTDDFTLIDDWSSNSNILNHQSRTLFKNEFVSTYRINGERRDISEAASWLVSHYFPKSLSESTPQEQRKRSDAENIIKNGAKIY